jgi:hypothetical protein
MPVITVWISLKYNQQDATFSQSIYFYKLLCMFQAVPHPSLGAKTVHTVDETELCSISSMIAAGSSIGLTIPDALCTVLCSWWWAEEPPETCGAIYRNKDWENVVSCWLYFRVILVMRRHKNVKIYNMNIGQKMTKWAIKLYYSHQYRIHRIYRIFIWTACHWRTL